MATVSALRVIDARGKALASLALPDPPNVSIAEVRLRDKAGTALATFTVSTVKLIAALQVQLLDAAGKSVGAVALGSPPPADVTEIQLLDAAKAVVSTAAIPASDGALPTNLDWYRDASKWLVTTSGAAIVFGYGFVAAAGASVNERLAFLASGVVLLASVLGGILCHFWILSFANAHEKLKSTSAMVDAIRLGARRQGARRWIGPTYQLMMWPFFIGMAIFVGFCTYRVFWPATPKDVPSPPTVLAGSGNDVVAVLYDPQQQRVLLLQRTGTGFTWIPAPDHRPAPPKPPAPAPPPNPPAASGKP